MQLQIEQGLKGVIKSAVLEHNIMLPNLARKLTMKNMRFLKLDAWLFGPESYTGQNGETQYSLVRNIVLQICQFSQRYKVSQLS